MYQSCPKSVDLLCNIQSQSSLKRDLVDIQFAYSVMAASSEKK